MNRHQVSSAPANAASLAPCTIARLVLSPDVANRQFSITTGLRQYTLLWVQEGSGQISIDADRLAICPRHIYCLRPGQRVQASMHGTVKGWQLTFSREFLDLSEKKAVSYVQGRLLHHFCRHPAIRLSSPLTGMLDTMINYMEQEQCNQDPLWLEVVRNLLRIFIINLCRHSGTLAPLSESTRRTEVVSNFFHLVEQHFLTRKRVTEYAALLSITPNYLTTIVRQESGFSPTYHIQQRIVLEAKRQAIFNRDSMKEIAYALGFCDPSHFSKYFKSTTGLNFSDFKKST